MNTELTPRLMAVANAVPKCNTVADIGTDHAYIPIYLVEQGIAETAIASDVVKGPAKRAAENIADHGMESKISVEIGNGLEKINDADVIVIAGMGGHMVCDILAADPNKAKKAKALVLQPMTCIYDVRKFLYANGYEIVSEDLAQEEHRIYNILVVKKGEIAEKSDILCHIGEYLINTRHPLLKAYIEKKIHSLKTAADNMANSETEESVKKRNEVLSLIDEFKKVGDTLD